MNLTMIQITKSAHKKLWIYCKVHDKKVGLTASAILDEALTSLLEEVKIPDEIQVEANSRYL